jgi:feruloyl esterase
MRMLIALLLVAANAAPAAAQPFANATSSTARYTEAERTLQRSCESLASFRSDGVTAIQARIVPAEGSAPPHCRVTGTIAPEIAFEVHLPERWNRRFYMTGNGGLAGDALDGPMNPERTAALTHGFVTARTNTGHDARQEPSGT